MIPDYPDQSNLSARHPGTLGRIRTCNKPLLRRPCLPLHHECEAEGAGFGPASADSKSAILPLDDPSVLGGAGLLAGLANQRTLLRCPALPYARPLGPARWSCTNTVACLRRVSLLLEYGGWGDRPEFNRFSQVHSLVCCRYTTATGGAIGNRTLMSSLQERHNPVI